MSDYFVLSRVRLHNFYLYYGDVDIDFNNNDARKNLFLFIFPNGGGKTSLYHAIKWGFYGNKFRYYKENQEMKPYDMINAYASKNGEGFFVEIDFFVNGEGYKLRRTCNTPHNGAEVVELMTPTDTKVGVDAKEYLETIIPSDYGKFFMFDGRDLSSLSEAQDDRGQVDSVLKLLGMSSIQTVKNRIIEVRKQYESTLTGQKKSNQDQSKAAEEYEAQCRIIEDYEKQLQGMDREISELKGDILSLKEKINQDKAVKELTAKRNSLNVDRQTHIANRNSCLEQLPVVRRYFHRFLLEKNYEFIVQDNSRELKRLQGVTGLDELSMKGFELSRAILDNSLPKCPACHKNIDPSDYETLAAIMESCKNKLEEQKYNAEKIAALSENKKFFEDLLKSDFEESYKILVKYRSACEKIQWYDTEISAIEDQIRHSGFDRIETWQNALDQRNTRYGVVTTQRSQIENEKAIAERKKDSAFARMKGSTYGDEEMSATINRIEFCNGLVSKLDSVVTNSIRRMRDSILRISNEFFKDITNKAEVYDHLEYVADDSYLMRIVKKDGTYVQHGSTGELQIVTMSFLMALSKCSGRSTPIVMDTPTTNLDVIHSQGIERSLKKIPNQVLFLAQPAESTDQFVEGVRDIIAKMYTTKHDDMDNAVIEEVEL